MEQFTKQECCDMTRIYWKDAQGNSRRAAQIYAETYPDRRHPREDHFRVMQINLLGHGSFKPPPRAG